MYNSTSVSVSSIDTTISVLDEEQEERSTKYDQITHFSYSSSDSSNADYVNKICLRFAGENSPSKYIKCKSFWQYLDSVPQLEALKALGWKDVTQTHSEETIENRLPPEIVRRRWLCQLLKLNALNLHEVALAGCPPYHDPCAEVVFADMVGESDQQAVDDIEAFEMTLKERESQRDPNQTVLGYKKKQPPPVRI